MKIKRFLALLVTLITVLGIMSLTALAYDENCQHTNAYYTEPEEPEGEPTCFESAMGGFWFCEDCWQYLDKDKENACWEPLPAAKIPATGHYFNTDTGVCDECGLANPVYTKVTSLDDVNEEDMYIIVAEIAGTEGTKYFVLGGLDERHPDEQGNVWCPTGVNNAIQVTANPDGSISLVNQEILEDGAPSEFMLDVNPEQFGDISQLGLTTLMLKLPNHCAYPFQSYSFDNNGYMGVPRYPGEYGMWDSSEWIIDFYTTVVTDDTYRYEDEFGSKTHAEQVEDGNIDDNITEGNLLLYKASFYSVGGAMFTLRLREYNNQYYFICGEDWCLEGSDGWDYVTDTTPTNDVQYAVSLYRYDVSTVDTHTCDFDDWVENVGKDTHTRTCKDSSCGKVETKPHDWDGGVETAAPTCTAVGITTYTCADCHATRKEDIPELGHSFGSWTENGKNHTRSCTNDGCTASESNPHSFGQWGEYTGFDGVTRHCTVDGCDAYETKSEAPPHTCTFGWWEEKDESTHERACTECGETEEANHSYGEWNPDPNDDMKHYRECECGRYEDGDHTYGEWTMKDENYHTHSCTTCGAVEDFEHNFYDWIAKDDNDHIHECMECEYESILPHDYVREVTKEPTLEETGEITYTCRLCSHFYTEELPKCVVEIENSTVDIVVNVPAGSNAYIPAGTTVDVVQMPTEQVPEQVLGEIAVTAEGAVKPLGMYDLSLLLDGAQIQPDGTVHVTLPAPDLAAEYDTIIVVYIAPDGSYEECKTTVNDDGTITFETNHFSQYAVIGITKDAGLDAGAIIGIILGVIALLGGGFCLYWFVIRKKM